MAVGQQFNQQCGDLFYSSDSSIRVHCSLSVG